MMLQEFGYLSLFFEFVGSSASSESHSFFYRKWSKALFRLCMFSFFCSEALLALNDFGLCFIGQINLFFIV